MASYVAAGYWRSDVMTDAYARYAREYPDAIACSDEVRSYSWRQVDEVSSRLAGSLIRLGLKRDERIVVQAPSDCREFVLRIALKKAGLIGAYVAIQWREVELGHTFERLAPAAVVMLRAFKDLDADRLLGRLGTSARSVRYRIALDMPMNSAWLDFNVLCEAPLTPEESVELQRRKFRYDEVSLVTTSSGTSGPAKLCEWPEAAQLSIADGIVQRLKLTQSDRVGVFAPMSGAAGALLWAATAKVPMHLVFPDSFDAEALVRVVERRAITVATTVPAVLARLSEVPLEKYQLKSLRAIRVGTAAMGLEPARSIEQRVGCRIVPAAGSMECPSFGHSAVDEPTELRLNGSVGLPLPGCRVRIEDDDGRELPPGETGHLKVSAPFASSGYWGDPEATHAAWADPEGGGWYSTGDMARIDANGRLWMVGRRKEIINRSGHKILPIELEQVISRHPDVLECAVVGAPHSEYGEVPWAFVLFREGRSCDAKLLSSFVLAQGVATYKVPHKFVEVREFPRVNGNKIDKKSLLSSELEISK